MIPRAGQIWELTYPHGYYMLVDIESKPNNVALFNLFSFSTGEIYKWASPFSEIPSSFNVLTP